jgi:GNAT superfamily N-acetyltransferase
MEIDILKADQNDLEEILQLQKDCYLPEAEIYKEYNIPPLVQDLKSLEHEFKKSVILKGIADGKIIASVRGFSKDGTCYIGRLIVHEDYQNKGIGKLLMNSIESIFRDCSGFELFTGFKSQKNLYLYNKLGYKEFKREKISDNLTFVYLEKNNTKSGL